jgi:hypothetical protein
MRSVTPVDELVVLLDALFPKFRMDRKNQRNRLFKCKRRLISSVHYGIDNSAFVNRAPSGECGLNPKSKGNRPQNHRSRANIAFGRAAFVA